MDTSGFKSKKVLVTGAGSGIGKAATKALLSSGSSVTAVDVSESGLAKLTQECAQHASHLFTATCDLCNDAGQADVFRKHLQRWGALDLALINAGIGEAGDVLGQDDVSKWQPTLDLDLRASIVGIQLAARAMINAKQPGTIIAVASAAGIFAHHSAPVYCAAKGGLVHFVRSVAVPLSKKGIHIAAVCPQFVDTALVANSSESFKKSISRFGKLMTPESIAEDILNLAQDPKRSGKAAVIFQNGARFDWDSVALAQREAERAASQIKSGAAAGAAQAPLQLRFAPGPLPNTYKAWQVIKLTHNFAEAVELKTLHMQQEVPDDSVLIRRVVTGVNASDVNFTSGKYQGSPAAAAAQIPFTAGFESVGVVCRAGNTSGLREGQAVATLTYGGFSEYGVERARFVVPVAAPTAEVVACLTSGLTASIALEEARLAKGETILVTAAAGGTGLFAVQLAKLAGMHVIGTCGSADKAAMLRTLGVNRVVNYKQEDLKQVLKAEYRKGVDVVYEGVGGSMFKAAVDALAFKGRLLVIGMMSQYGDGWPVDAHPGLPEKLLKKSASLIGFFLPAYANRYKVHLEKLVALHTGGRLKIIIDERAFNGIAAVPAAVQHLQAGKSFGKVVVNISPAGSPLSKL